MIGIFMVITLIFIISSNLISMPGTTVTLPKISGAQYETGEKLIVTISAERRLFYNGEEVTWDKFREKLDAWVKALQSPQNDSDDIERTAHPKIIVCADEGVQLKDWVELANIARELGLDFVLSSDLQSKRTDKLPQKDISISDE
jgi:biopolymer transport protein ExbD